MGSSSTTVESSSNRRDGLKWVLQPLSSLGGLISLSVCVQFFAMFRQSIPFISSTSYQWMALSFVFAFLTGCFLGIPDLSDMLTGRLRINWRSFAITSIPQTLLAIASISISIGQGLEIEDIFFLDLRATVEGTNLIIFMLAPVIFFIWTGSAFGKSLGTESS